jgi:uncharacterized membrane protein (DUF485 family)
MIKNKKKRFVVIVALVMFVVGIPLPVIAIVAAVQWQLLKKI